MSSVSVVIPTYNLAAYLEQAVQSVLRQTHQPLEILIVENNSVDDTALIARSLESRHGDLIRVIHEPKQGAPYARNRGLQEAKGEWIQFLDGDDLLLPQKLQYQLTFTRHDIGFIAGAAIERHVDGSASATTIMPDIWKGLFSGGGHLGFTSSNLWNAAALRAVHGWDTTLSRNQEYDLMFRLLSQGYKAFIAPEMHTIKQERASGQITDVAYTVFLCASMALRYRILTYALARAEFEAKTIRYFLKMYFRSYSRLRVRDSVSAERIKQQYMKPLLSRRTKKRYPIIYLLEIKSDAYTFLKRLKKFVGKYGLGGYASSLLRHNPTKR